ncbi:MAG TPA: ABC transporter substrate-binding protein [Opitutaceae bacterium]|nr:ABC transporter substrate-binding protein [Opitutaceae bacterium]
MKSPFLSGGLGVAGAVVGFTALLYLCALGLRPDVNTPPEPEPPAEVARAVEARKLTLHKDNPPRVQQEVNYSEGSKAAWWPKGEAPVLSELVQEGALPPVAERVGSEPIVLAGVEGNGNYGGTWHRLGASDYDVSTVSTIISYGNLVRWSPEGYPIVPHIAKSWEISPDYRVFTFHLRQGMKWSDGAPVTADDFVYWYEMEVKGLDIPPPEVLRYQGDVGRLEKVDDLTIRFTFTQPYALFLERLASVRTWTGPEMADYCTPSHYLRQYHPKFGDKELIERTMRRLNVPTPRALYIRLKEWKNPECPRLWPWVIRNNTESSPWVFVRNPYYPAVDPSGNQLPYLDRLVMEVRPQELFGLTAASGQVSMQDRYIRYDDHVLLTSEARRNGYEVYNWYSGLRSPYTIFPVLNRAVDPAHPETKWKHQLLNDRRFRQALSLALNRQDIIDALFNGQGKPAQLDPGPESSFHSPELFHSFTQYDPKRANALLDELGLTKRDHEGYRTFPDGSRMVWYLNMTEVTNNDPAQFIVDDWAEVGIRCVSRIRARFLFLLEKSVLDHDFTVWHGESEFMPLIEPRNFVPTYADAFYAPGFGLWYSLGGMHGSADAKVPRAIEPAPGSPIRRNMALLDEIYRTPDRAKQHALFAQIAKTAAEEVWTITIGTPPPQLVVVKNGFRNVPRNAVWQGAFESPGNTGVETYFWEKPHDPPAVVADLKRSLRAPAHAAAVAATESSSSSSFGTLLGWLFAAVLVALVALVAFRHPFIARRLMMAVPTLVIVSIVVFTIVQLPPGDFASTRALELESQGTPDGARAVKELRAVFHLDESKTAQYLRWVGLKWFVTFDARDRGLLQGDLGRSMELDRSVNSVVGDRIMLTVVVTLATIVLTWAVAVPIGIYSAVRQYSAGDYVLTFLGFLGMSIPGFLLALVLMYLSHRFAGLNPTGLFSPEFASSPGWSWPKFLDLLKHLWLPTVVLGLGGTAGMVRVMRANLLDELRRPYVTTARAKGVSELRLLIKYPVRLALNPFVSGVGSMFPALVSGGAIVAIVMSLPMIGPIMLTSLLSEDVYLAGSMLMVMTVLAVLGTLVSDLLLLWLDPRIRFEKPSR